VVVVSGSHRVMAPSAELIPAAVVTKPFELAALLALLDRILAPRSSVPRATASPRAISSPTGAAAFPRNSGPLRM
jgi:hypothetical protein